MSSEAKAARQEASSTLGFSGVPSPTVSHGGRVEEEAVGFETSLGPIVEEETAPRPASQALYGTPEEEAPCPGVSLCSGKIVGCSPASCFRSDGPRVARCFQVAPPPQGDADSSAWPLNDSEAGPLNHSSTVTNLNVGICHGEGPHELCSSLACHRGRCTAACPRGWRRVAVALARSPLPQNVP